MAPGRPVLTDGLVGTSAAFSSRLEDTSMAYVARVSTDIPWSHECLLGQCHLGSLAADAIAEWAGADTTCLIPSRFLGGGLRAGSVKFEHLAEILPPHPLVSLDVSASHLRQLLLNAQSTAWSSCAAPSSARSWQLSSNLRFGWTPCNATSAVRLELRGKDGSFALAEGDMPVKVLTLAPALPLLLPEGGGSAVHHFAISAQHAVADYLRAHSPYRSSEAATDPRIHIIAPAALVAVCQPSSSCVSHAPAITRVAAVLGVSAYDAAHVHATAVSAEAALVMLVLLLIAIICVSLWLRRWLDRRAEALPASQDPPLGGPGTCATPDGLTTPDSASAVLPIPPMEATPFGAPSMAPSSLLGAMRRAESLAMHDPEMQPLKTGGLRVASRADLGA
eukprot:CAMPEP_0115835342 /NCGR_PEP_ID=MMETSP0287-20121206/4145_1 /TAXON_ID=412157 /ORGANISM="Chrysochromulina rotalis, Strain UIO044" /LENGTH=391 /DNA_ID=CAMNT_0003288797 /DNA_START=12 /DNA_END=1187 /DNA_ORIENTATION=+